MKRFIIAGAVSLVLNFICMIVNYLSFLDSNYLMWSIKMYGGEYMGEFSPGLRVNHIYGMRPEDGNTHTLHFSPVTLIISLLVIFGAVLLIMLIISKIRGKRR